MSKGLFKGKVVIEEETEDERGKVTDKLNNSVAAIDIESRIVVEESLFESEDEEDETSNMSMAVDGDDPKPFSRLDKPSATIGTRECSLDDGGSEALDLSFIPCSIPLKKRKISSLPITSDTNRTLNEIKKKSDDEQHLHRFNYHPHQHSHSHQHQNNFHQKIITTRDTSAFNQLTDNSRLNSFNLQSSQNHFPFTLRALPSATSSSTNNCKPLSLVKNQQLHPNQHQHQQTRQSDQPQHYHQSQLNFSHLLHQQQHHQNQSNHNHLQQQHPNHPKYLQYQHNQQKQDFNLGNKSTGLGSSTSGQTKGMSCRRPGFITCSICNATKYYSHVQRRFGQYSCEPCSKFMKRFLRDPKIFTCSHKGNCTIGKPSGEQEPRGVSVNRCKACWLKICLEKFILDSETRIAIDKYYAPKFCDSSDSSLSTSTEPVPGSIGGLPGEEGSEVNNTVNNNGEEGGEMTRLMGKSSSGEGDGETGKTSQSAPCDRIETNGCDTTLSPPPLPFPQRKRKPKGEPGTSSTSSSSTSSSSPSSLSSTPTNYSSTSNNNSNNNKLTPNSGESIPLSTSQSGNSSRNVKDKHHSTTNQYHSLSTSTHSDNRNHHSHHLLHSHPHHPQQQRESSFFGSHSSSGHLLTEPLCLTTSGRRSDLFSSGLLGNLSSTSRSSLSSSNFVSDKLLGLTPLGPRYPWSHRRKDDYDSISLFLGPTTTASTTTTTLTSHSSLINRRESDDDLTDIYHGDYSLTSPDLVLGGPFSSVGHFIKDMNGEGDVDGNIMVMGSPSTPPPPTARCGKCSYCLPTIDEKANVVVVKENCGPVRCRLAELMSASKLNQNLSNNKKEDTDENGSGTTLVTSTGATTTTSTTSANDVNSIDGDSKHNNKRPVSTTSEGDDDAIEDDYNYGSSHLNKGQEEGTVHSSTPISSLVNVNFNRRNRKDRRGHSKSISGGGNEKEDNESGFTSQEGMMNDDENLDQESRESNRDGYRKRIVSGDDDDQSVSLRGYHGSSRSSKSNKSVMFNKPYKKLLINEHFVNSSLINNQASNSNNHSNLLSSRDLSGPVISPDSNFLSEILNANSPFL